MNHICFDHRLNVKMSSLTTTYLNPVIEFQMRVFRFRDPTESAHTKQEQDIVCEIYLEEAESTYGEKQCECYTPDECSGKAPPVVVTEPSSYIADYYKPESTVNMPGLEYKRIFSIPAEYAVRDSDTPAVDGFTLPKYFKMSFDVWFDIIGRLRNSRLRLHKLCFILLIFDRVLWSSSRNRRLGLKLE